jgi:hypothetical protein
MAQMAQQPILKMEISDKYVFSQPLVGVGEVSIYLIEVGVLFQSLYLRLRSTVSRHLKVGKRWRREKRQPSAKETKEDFYVGVV